MGKKRRGHAWSLRKGYWKKKEELSNQQKSSPPRSASQQKSRPRRSAEEWRQYLLTKYNGHTTQCHFFGIRRGCMACYNNYRIGNGFFASGGF